MSGHTNPLRELIGKCAFLVFLLGFLLKNGSIERSFQLVHLIGLTSNFLKRILWKMQNAERLWHSLVSQLTDPLVGVSCVWGSCKYGKKNVNSEKAAWCRYLSDLVFYSAYVWACFWIAQAVIFPSLFPGFWVWQHDDLTLDCQFHSHGPEVSSGENWHYCYGWRVELMLET